MKKIFITICLSIICNFLFAQNKTVDSLKKVLKTTKDVHKRIDLYAEIGNNLIALNLDLAKPYTDTAFKIANTCNYEKGLAKVFNNYGKIYYRHSEYEKSLLYLEKSVALYKKMDNKERIGTLLSNIAIINIEKGDLELALNNLTQSITILEKTNNKFQLASSYNILGGYYLNISKFKESNEYFFKALKLKELIKDTIGQIISFNNIFINFYNLNDFEKAIFYNQKSMNLSKLVKDTMGIADCILNEACVLSSKKECKIAIEKYFECYKLYKSIDNKNSMCLTLGNIGNNYIRLKDYDNALNYLKQSLDIAKVIDNKLRIIFALRQIGETYNFDGNPKKAIPFIDSSLVISKKINNLDEIKTNLFTLAESYKLLGNFEKAFYLVEEAGKLKDSIFSIEDKKNISEIEVLYQTQKKQTQITKLSLENEQKQNYILGLILLSVLIFIAASLLFLFLHRRNKRRNQQLVLKIHESEKDRNFHYFHSLGNKLMTIAHSPEDATKQNIYSLGQEMRQFSHQQFSPDFEKINLKEKLKEILLEYQTFINGEVAYTNNIEDKTWKKIGTTIQRLIYRSVQELLQNTVKHADASLVKLTLAHAKRRLTVYYQDNGKGANADVAYGKGMQEIDKLIRMFKGTVEVETSPNNGYFCTIEIPLKRFYIF